MKASVTVSNGTGHQANINFMNISNLLSAWCSAIWESDDHFAIETILKNLVSLVIVFHISKLLFVTLLEWKIIFLSLCHKYIERTPISVNSLRFF